jgi:DNA-3-methyladenine glycosylase
LTLTARAADDPPTPKPVASLTSWQSLDGAFLTGTPTRVAQALLGAVVVRDDGAGCRAGRIVETEAYAGPEDRASHARAGRTSRTSVMFGPAGRAYVYLVYGMHHCLNVVCGPDGEAAAVLIRAVQPIEGIERMRMARRQAIAGGARTEGTGVGGAGQAEPVGDARLAAGPARLCQALSIDGSLGGIDRLTDRRLRLVDPAGGEARLGPHAQVVAGPRVGVAYAGAEWGMRPWRFGIAGHASLSHPFSGVG